ncbi:MAG: nucleotidyltransferase [Bacillus sp. (in: Bacteria)]|nr:nucleotidyltransferase [Bacillus sp. (in: firmicutes)]MCM1426028.1 nucleotidyltransferase [Eubacterium sp.]
MKTTGIIAEYNPFHNGHAYHIAKAKEMTGADYCIIIMSGNYVQRGAPAIMDKGLRAHAALMCGADLVIELPVHYAAASAEYFAEGAAALLDRLGVADSLCFGSECGDLQALLRLSDVLLSENTQLKSLIRENIKAGYSYPQARSLALTDAYPQLTDEILLMQQPNNILGVEYLKALKKRNSRIIPYTISRDGGGYHDASLQSVHSSALAIRNFFMENGDISLLQEHIPAASYQELVQAYQKFFPVLADDFSALLAYKLMQAPDDGLSVYFDIDKDFSDKVKKLFYSYTDFTSFCDALKSKNMTYTRISRNLLHILLNIYQEDIDNFRARDYVFYARILGFKKESAPLLTAIKANSSIPLISKLADAPALISSPYGRSMLTQEIQADDIYRMVLQQKFHRHLPNEYQRQIIIV